MADRGTLWLPELSLYGNDMAWRRWSYEVMTRIYAEHADIVRRGAEKGARIAPASCSGAYGVEFGKGTKDEYRHLAGCGVDAAAAERCADEYFTMITKD